MADDKPVILLNAWASPFGMRVRVALALKGVEYENREEDLPYNKSPLLLQMNSVHKKVPVLVHNGKPICESLIILQYIDEVWCQTPSLMPADHYKRARARFLADFIDKKVLYIGWKIWKGNGEAQEAAKKELMEGLKLLEEELGNNLFFGGDELGYVDVVLSFFACWFHIYEKYGNFKIEEEQPKIMAWVKRCMNTPSFSKSMPDPNELYEFLVDYEKKTLGVK